MDVNKLIQICRTEVEQGGFQDMLQEFDLLMEKNRTNSEEEKLIKAMTFTFYANYRLGTWSAP